MRPFPWETAMMLGLSRLRLSPEMFWGLSLQEFSVLAGMYGQSTDLSRREVEALMQRFPD
jgi:uncharacterized phage protein (TIGR02216 family)